MKRSCRVEYETRVRDGDKNVYEEETIDFCCQVFARMYNLHLSPFSFNSRFVSETNRPKIEIVSEGHISGNDRRVTSVVEYCPFCGAKIEYVETRRYQREWVEREIT